ncbi:MAG: hypothetical protein J6Y28_09860 [Acholeplasmatales bacterium]|nr:hypothetical protein [Methanobrevibacter sp.]MBP5446464.1 hypothetical protein [Acholeplasmatales bacterium]
MNLSAYDTIPKIDKNTTWTNIKRNELLSREIKFRLYYTIGKRFNTETQEFDYYIAMLDNKQDAAVTYKTKYDTYGRIKISLKWIWDETYLSSLDKDINITINHIEHFDDGDVYKLDL